MASINNILELIDYLVEGGFEKFVFSNMANKEVTYKKINLNLKVMGDKKIYQAEKYTQTQVFHENLELDYLRIWIENNISSYKNINAWTDDFSSSIRISKKGKVFITEKKEDNKKLIQKSKDHNKKKNYILKEGEDIEPLKELGIFTKDGKIVNSSYNKYKQINRFVEFIDDEIKKIDFSSEKKSIYDGREYDFTVLDFGCGKSYLTFVTYYYLRFIKGIKVRIIGLDLKEKVIDNCNNLARKYGYDDLSFEVGDIHGYRPRGDIDMVISLHACDTATDFSIFNAINWGAKYIFSVPCCQHEFNSTIRHDEYHFLTDFGIVKERMAALMTDSIRGKLLRGCGYRTQLLEFIDIEHSPKNILIRAVKKDARAYDNSFYKNSLLSDNGLDNKNSLASENGIEMKERNDRKKQIEKRKKEIFEVRKALDDFNVSSTLYELLKNNGNLDLK